MTIKELQDELKRIKKFYQMFGKDAEVMDETIHTLDYIESLIGVYEHYIDKELKAIIAEMKKRKV